MRLHSPVYRRRSHLPPGTGGKKTRVHRTMRGQRSGGPISRLGIPRPRRQKKSAGPPGRASRWDATALLPGVKCPDSSTICISPGEPENSWLESGAEVAGLDFGGARERVPQRAPVSAQLANSGTFAKLPRAGEQLRSGPHHRGPRGGSGPPWAPRSRAERKEHREAAARGSRLSAADTEEAEAGHAARRGSRAAASAEHPHPAAAALWRSPAPRPASGGSAAELERGRRRGRFSSRSCCRRRADGRTRGTGGGAAGPAGRGGADRPR